MEKSGTILKIAVCIILAGLIFFVSLSITAAASDTSGYEIKGVVIRPFDNKYVKSCAIDIQKDGKWYGGIRTDNLGRFKIPNLADGTYELRAFPDRYSWDMVFSRCALSEKFTVEVRDGAYSGPAVILRLRLPQISGEVMDEYSRIPGDWTCLVRIINEETGRQLDDQVFTNGEFHTAGLSDGTYTIRVVYYADDKKYNRESNVIKFKIKNGKYNGPEMQFTLIAR